MRKTLLLYFFLGIALQSFGQDEPRITTFILMRHAEKSNDGTKDPELAAEGAERAKRLSEMLRDVSINAIYSTNFKRTKNTITPLATAKGIEVQVYESFKADGIDQVLKKYAGGTVVICGHSNTIPGIVNLLAGKEQFKNLDDSDYSSLFIVSVVEVGKVTSVTRLRY